LFDPLASPDTYGTIFATVVSKLASARLGRASGRFRVSAASYDATVKEIGIGRGEKGGDKKETHERKEAKLQ
jgi:hypothetical protein